MASSNPPGIANMIVQYEWIFENVEVQPRTFASKMITFRGEKVFRVGLKNYFERPVLFFMAINLNKIGMKVEGVMCGVQGSGIGPATMWRLAKENIGDDDGNLQLFSTELFQQVIGNYTFVFRICIEGSVPGYSYQLSDRLAKNQLHHAALNDNLADVEFVVKGEKFYAHKAILAARSPVFAAKFTMEQPAVNAAVGPHQIRIGGVEPSTVEQFLRFIYTGESIMVKLANEELLKLAVKYKLSTLARLCRTAIKKTNPMQMVNLMTHLNKGAEIPSSEIGSDVETEIFFDRTTPTFRCALTFDISNKQLSKCIMKYRNEEIFFADITGKFEKHGNHYRVYQPVIHCSCAQHRKFGLHLEDIYVKHAGRNKWFKMDSKNFQKDTELQHLFTTQRMETFHLPIEIYFDIKVINTIGSYSYEMMDEEWMIGFWRAATNRKFTDVVIFVGKVKVMEAHLVILCARSPVLNASFNKPGNEIEFEFKFSAEFKVDIVKHFLKFLYTGSLEASASKSIDYKQLLKLAIKYKVETLEKMCRFASYHVPDVEDLTKTLLKL